MNPVNKHIFTEKQDTYIKEVFRSPNKKRESIRKAAQQLNIPYRVVLRRLKELGCVGNRYDKDNYKKWSPQEIRILEKTAYKNSLLIQEALRRKGFKRSISAIISKRKAIGFFFREQRYINGVYSAYETAELLGVKSHTVLAWIKRGMLKASSQHGEKQKKIFNIKRRDIYLLLTQHLPEVDIYNADKYWLVDLLTNGAMGKSDDSE